MSIVTPEGRLSFPSLFEPKQGYADSPPKYEATILLPKDGEGVAEFIRSLQAQVKAEIEKKWPNPDNRPGKLRMGIKDGDTVEFENGANAGKLKKEKYPEFAGCWTIHATSKNAPQVVDSTGQFIKSAAQVKAGYWVRISFDIFAYNNKNVGVGCGLHNVLFVRADEPFGGGSNPAADFAEFFESQAPSEFKGEVTPADNDLFA